MERSLKPAFIVLKNPKLNNAELLKWEFCEVMDMLNNVILVIILYLSSKTIVYLSYVQF